LIKKFVGNIAMLPKAKLLAGVEHPDTLSRVLDLAEQALRTWEIVQTDFLSPLELLEAQTMLTQLTELHGVCSGGYPQAERQRCAIARSEFPLESSDVALSLLSIAGNFLFDPATHPDFLGALLGSGIVREKVGDIVVLGERGAQVIVDPSMVDYLSLQFTQVRTVPVTVTEIPFLELKVRAPQTKEIVTVEASLRLDAIASAGFGMSRGKMVDLIATGDVRVNWKEVKQASYLLKTGDLIAIRGKGRLQVGEVSITKKERYRMVLTRWL
jgi:photosystem II S4 domain protein